MLKIERGNFLKKKPEITDATRNAFIDAFCKLYKKTPIEKISILQVTNVAGYNRTTFYHYFKDIYDLLTYIEDDVILYVKENIITNIRGGNLEEEFILTFAKTYKGKEKYIKVLLDNSNSERFIQRLKMELFHDLLDVFNLPKDDVTVNYILDFYSSAVLSVISRWIRNQDDMTQTELATLIRNMLTKGVLPELNKYCIFQN